LVLFSLALFLGGFGISYFIFFFFIISAEDFHALLPEFSGIFGAVRGTTLHEWGMLGVALRGASLHPWGMLCV
jgi:hypothetical protein